MKKTLFLIFILMTAQGCPTCVGRAKNDSSLFFTQEFYKKNISGDHHHHHRHTHDVSTEKKEES